jgi:hypothetical protein
VEEHAGAAMDDEANERVVELCRQQRRKVVEHSQQHLPRQLTMVVVGRVSHAACLHSLSTILSLWVMVSSGCKRGNISYLLY